MNDSTTGLREQLATTLGAGYTVEREFGRGGMSHVFLAYDQSLGRRIVVKVLDPELASGVSADRFKREIMFMARLQHPHIVPIFSAGEVVGDGLPFYTMPFVEGDTLRARIKRDGPMPLGDVLGIVRDVADALEFAHGNNIVHRDIKPENILLSGRSATVSDFGVAKALSASTTSPGADSSTLTSMGLSLGTPMYMSPEQAVADPSMDSRSDLYALGTVAYEMLCGKAPFHGRSVMALIAAHVSEEPVHIDTLRADTPRVLADLVMRCLAKDPADRVQSATEFLSQLDKVRVGESAGVGVRHAALDAEERPSIAVLPFRNMSGVPDSDYLSDGITEEVLNALARVPSLRVAARTSSFAFKNQGVEAQRIARTLHVNSLLEGSVRQSGRRLRVSAQLSNAADGFQIWSERYDRELEDIFALQDDIAASIVEALREQLNLPGTPTNPSPRRAPADLEAYELYLKGRYFLNQRADGMWKAVEYYERALERDPDLALAHAGVAEGYGMLTLYSAIPPRQGVPKAQAAARRALALDPDNAEACVVLSSTSLWYDRDPEESLRQIERAIALSPSNSLAHACHGYIFSSLGKHEEAIDRAAHAVHLDPLGIFAVSNMAVVYYLARQFKDAIACCHSILEMAPNNTEAYRWMAICQFHLKEWDNAFKSIQQAVLISNRQMWPLANMGAMLARAKRRDEAIAILKELEHRSATEAITPLAPATVYYGLGDLDNFYIQLDRAIEERDFWLIMLHVDPGFDALRKDPRFGERLRALSARA